jgi:outer membrane immunogenic protein
MRKASGLIGATLLFAGPAFAADLAVKAPVMPTMAPVLGWTGFYLGGNVGYGWGDEGVNFSGTGLAGTLIGNGVIASSLANNARGPIGGAQAGYNWQTGAFVVGIEADIQAADINATDSFTSVTPRATWVTNANQDLTFLGTVRGRLGFTITPALLLYGTGGFAYGQGEVSSGVNATATTSPTNMFSGALTTSSWMTGWAAGGGLEYMITPNLTAKFEYLYYDLGTLSQTYGDGLGRFPGTSVNTGTDFKGNIVRIGANYKF